MEKICKSPKLLDSMVQYGFFLLETPIHESKTHGALFFHYSLKFRQIFDMFEKTSGVKTMLSKISGGQKQTSTGHISF